MHRVARLREAGPARRPAGDDPLGPLELLAELDPSIEVRPDDRYVDSGEVITSAGVSAGIDMALHLVMRLAGAERAREVSTTSSTTRSRRSDPSAEKAH